MQHPEPAAVRQTEGGNKVDEGDALAQDDVKRRWPTTGASQRCGNGGLTRRMLYDDVRP